MEKIFITVLNKMRQINKSAIKSINEKMDNHSFKYKIIENTMIELSYESEINELLYFLKILEKSIKKEKDKNLIIASNKVSDLRKKHKAKNKTIIYNLNQKLKEKREFFSFIKEIKYKKSFAILSFETYSNLVYSCSSCNGSKSNKWPTKDPNKSNENGVGFVDPCNITYRTLFDRSTTGEIIHNGGLSEWMYIELKKEKELTLDQEEELFKNYQFLDEIYPDQKLVPVNLKDIKSINQLSSFVKKTEEILKKLEKLSKK